MYFWLSYKALEVLEPEQSLLGSSPSLLLQPLQGGSWHSAVTINVDMVHEL